MKHTLSQFIFAIKSISAPLRSDFGTLEVQTLNKTASPQQNQIQLC